MLQQYPVIDADPTVYKVVSLFRASEYLTILSGVVVTVGAMRSWHIYDPIPQYKRTLFWGGAFGLLGGFMLAYQISSQRLWGVRENAREIEMHKKLRKKETVLDPHLASVSYRNTKNSQLLLSVVPVFNFSNHNKGIPEENK